MAKPITEAKLSPVSNINGIVGISTNGTKAGPSARLASWKISWDDGSIPNSGIGKPPLELYHAYAESGNYNIILNVRDNKNKIAEDTMGMIVQVASVPIPPIPPVGCTINVPTGNFIDVNSAVSGVVDGDVVCLPGGLFVWTGRLSPPAGVAFTLKGIGAGTDVECNVLGQVSKTCITMDSSVNLGLLGWGFNAGGNLRRVTGITWDSGTGPSIATTNGLLAIFSSSAGFIPNWRFDNNKVYIRRGPGLFVNNVLGVHDHNVYYPSDSQIAFYAFHPTWGGNDYCPGYQDCGDAAWADDSWFGSNKFLFLEDELVIATAPHNFFIDGWKGRRVVVRESVIVNATLQNHGTDSSGRYRGARAEEYYRNTLCASTIAISASMASRGGASLVWGNNAITDGSGACAPYGGGGLFSRVYDITYQRLTPLIATQCSYWGCCNDDTPITPPSWWNFGQDGAGPKPTNSWDQGAGTTMGYACMDQGGRGKGDIVYGDEFSTIGALNQALGIVAWPRQVLDPIYTWNNNLNGANNPAAVNVSLPGYIVENRDYYTEGSLNGMQHGTIAARSLTCNVGEGYFADDEGTIGKMYICTALNTWSARYGSDGTNTTGLPYTYPHPLTLL